MHKLNTKTSWICSMISPYKNHNSKIIGCAFNCAEYVVMEKKESYNIFVWTIIIVCLCSSNIDCFCFSFWILCLFRILWRGTHQLFKGSLILAFVYFEHIVYVSWCVCFFFHSQFAVYLLGCIQFRTRICNM